MIKVFLNGNLVKDPELKTTQGGKQVASFTVADNRGKDKTVYVNCIAWEKTGELIAQYFGKGDRFCGVGDLDIRKYDDKDGVTKYVTEITVNGFDFPPKNNAGKLEERSGQVAEHNPDIPF